MISGPNTDFYVLRSGILPLILKINIDKRNIDCVCWFEGNEDGGLPSARAIPEGVLPPGVGGKLLADVPCLMVLGNLLGGV